MLLLDNPIQNYAWGSRTSLASLLGRPPSTEPEAELWIGAHARAPSTLRDGRSLLELIRSDPSGTLGPGVVQRFGAELPFLLKVLAVAAPLSLQAHPNLEQARAGFEREQAQGVALEAFERTYKDRNHKPELLCALTRFEALSGFRAPAASATLFESLGLGDLELVARLRSRAPEPLRLAFSELMTLAARPRAELAQRVLERCQLAQAEPGPFRASIRWAARLGQAYPGDIGAVASLLLQHLTLEPLQAMYLESGRLHAYLEGTGVEIMANSDNVLRGGLTPKHVDLPELLRVLHFDSPELLPTPTRQVSPAERAYETPAPEFRLSCIELGEARAFVGDLRGPELLLCVAGELQVSAPAVTERGPERLRQGQACFLPAQLGRYELAGTGRVFRATIGGVPS
jgi:mannose-6-phosphate isomerase